VRRNLDKAASMDEHDAIYLDDRREPKSAQDRLEGDKLSGAWMHRLIEQVGYLKEIYEPEDRVTLRTDLILEQSRRRT
jgi:hypothetical protein